MPFRRGFVVFAGALRKHETVLRAGIPLDTRVDTDTVQVVLQGWPAPT